MRFHLKWVLVIFVVVSFLIHLFYLKLLSDSLKIELAKNLETYTDFYVIANLFNPAGFESRYESYKRFEEHILQFGVQLITVELAFNNQSFRVTNMTNKNHIQLRTNDTLWYKENLINIGLKRLPVNCKYVAWIDLEVEFTNEYWVSQTKQSLEKFKVVQLFEYVRRLGPNSEIIGTDPAFCRCQSDGSIKSSFALLKEKYSDFRKKVDYCTTGFAWASTKDTLLEIGGLFDRAIVGEGDYLIAQSFVGKLNRKNFYYYNKNFFETIMKWQNLTFAVMKGSVGYIDGPINHKWHGSSKNRNYTRRRLILDSLKYKPNKHLYYDENGLLKFIPDVRDRFINKIGSYFISRKEDSLTVIL